MRYGAPMSVRSWVREPMLHFALLGAIVFMVYEQRHPGLPDSPSDHELLYREALALGLDRDDPIVRRRLVQKMELLIADMPGAVGDTKLEAYLRAHPERFAIGPRVSFTHVFIDGSRRDDPEAAARALLNASDPTTGGDPFLRGASFASMTDRDIGRVFGDDMITAIRNAGAGWSGPHRSKYGAHLVCIDSRTAQQLPDLDSVRAQVEAAVLEEQRDAARTKMIAELRQKYRR